jgi:CheY-like chemotaxis protein
VATVLVVDDREINRTLVKAVLGYRGHEMMEAGGGAEALELLGQHQPDLVVADVVMPGMDGYALARAIRAAPHTRRIPVLFYTANYLIAAATDPQADGLGIARIVTKNGDLTELVDAVEDALAETASGPEPTGPEPTGPEPTDPEPTGPEPTDPEPTDPEPTDPEPTDPT